MDEDQARARLTGERAEVEQTLHEPRPRRRRGGRRGRAETNDGPIPPRRSPPRHGRPVTTRFRDRIAAIDGRCSGWTTALRVLRPQRSTDPRGTSRRRPRRGAHHRRARTRLNPPVRPQLERLRVRLPVPRWLPRAPAPRAPRCASRAGRCAGRPRPVAGRPGPVARRRGRRRFAAAGPAAASLRAFGGAGGTGVPSWRSPDQVVAHADVVPRRVYAGRVVHPHQLRTWPSRPG